MTRSRLISRSASSDLPSMIKNVIIESAEQLKKDDLWFQIDPLPGNGRIAQIDIRPLSSES